MIVIITIVIIIIIVLRRPGPATSRSRRCRCSTLCRPPPGSRPLPREDYTILSYTMLCYVTIHPPQGGL